MNNLKFVIAFLGILFISCQQDLEPSKLVDQNISQFQESECLNFKTFEFETLDFISSKTRNNRLFLEYSLKPIGDIPTFFEEEHLNEKNVIDFRKIIELDDSGVQKNFFMVVLGSLDHIGESISQFNLNSIPKSFDGKVIIYDDQSNFLEAYNIENGIKVQRYQILESSSCSSSLSSRDELDDCITIYYQRRKLEWHATYTDWFQISPYGVEYLSTSVSYESFPSVFLETFTYCPGDDGTDHIPIGDDGGITPKIKEHKECIRKARQLIEQGFHNPCQPDKFAGPMILQALGGEWSGCKDEETLLSDLNTYLGTTDLNLSFDQLLALNELSDKLACGIISQCTDPDNLSSCMEEIYNQLTEANEDGLTDVKDENNNPFTGEKENIPDCINLGEASDVSVTFSNTSDNINSNQAIAPCLIDALVSALSCAGSDFDITEINISSTTNGVHSPSSNHPKGLAIDINKFNGVRLIDMTEEELELVTKFQECLEEYDGIRENFGPSIKKKLNNDYSVGGHKDHLHFSVNSGHNCDYDSDAVDCN